MGERNGTVTSKQGLILSTCYSNKSSDKRKQATTPSLSTRISKTYQNIIKFKCCGSGLKTQQISGGIFRYLQISPTHQRNIDLSHGIYRKPAAAARHHEAWPTKPRSVSHWPGLAGLKAARLSAGRPGRLRTLAHRRQIVTPRRVEGVRSLTAFKDRSPAVQPRGGEQCPPPDP